MDQLRVDSWTSAKRLVKKCHFPFSCSSQAYRLARSFGKHGSGRIVSIQSVIANAYLSVSCPARILLRIPAEPGCLPKCVMIIPATSSALSLQCTIIILQSDMPDSSQIGTGQNKMRMPLFYAALQRQSILSVIPFRLERPGNPALKLLIFSTSVLEISFPHVHVSWKQQS